MSDRPIAEKGSQAKSAAANPILNQTPGQMLFKARESMGVSLSEVAHEINLPENKLEALEADDYQALLAPTFVKGYLRSCCRYYKLDAAQVLANYELHSNQLTESGVVTEPPVAQSQPLEKPFPEWSWAVLAGGVVVVLMAVFFLWGGSDAEPEVSPPDAKITNESNDLPADTGRSVSATDDADNTAANEAIKAGQAEVDDTLASTVPQTNERAEAEAAAEQRAQLASEIIVAQSELEAQQGQPAVQGESLTAEAAAELPSPVVTANQPKDELEFYFAGDCWIEVFDGAGQRLHQSLSRTGDTLTVVGNAPFSIMLGNARVAALQLNGVAVPVKPRPGQNTLRLTVGDEL